MSVYLREKKLKNGRVSFYLDINHNGKRWPETLGIYANKNKPTEQDKTNRFYAQQKRAKRENELLLETNDLKDPRKESSDFITWFEFSFMASKKAINGYCGALFQLKAFTENRPLAFKELNRETVLKFQKFLLARVANNGAFMYMKNVNTALKEAVRQKFLKQNPFELIYRHEKVKKQDTKMTAFTIEELSALANTKVLGMPSQIREIFLFGCFTGLRWSDSNSLKWSEIIVKVIEGKERYFIYFDQQKTSGVEYLPLSAQAVAILKHRKAESATERVSEYVFPEMKETNEKTKRKWNWMKYWILKWAPQAKIEKRIHFHCARHTFATNVLEHSPDGDLYTVSKLLGHKSIIATQIYAKVRDKKRAEAVDALPMLDIIVKNNENTPVLNLATKARKKGVDSKQNAA